jgi:hypothetical protein
MAVYLLVYPAGIGFMLRVTRQYRLILDATPYLSLIFDSPLDLGGFRGKSTYIQHPGTAEPFRIAPAEPVAYTNLVIYLR